MGADSKSEVPMLNPKICDFNDIWRRALQWANSFYNYQNNPTGNNLGNNFFCLEKKMLADIGSESKLKYKKKIYSSSLSIVNETAWI